MKIKYHRIVVARVLFFLIVLFAFLVRIYDVNWDNNYHLHPDERFLTMVGNAMQIPKSFGDYLNPTTSTFNPANIGYQFYVYGTLPLTINKILAIYLHSDNYNDFTIQGRLLAAAFDTLVVILIYKISQFFERKYKLHNRIKYYAAFFYSISVLAIQLSHFYAVDPFVNCFTLASLCFALYALEKRYYMYAIFSGICMGLATASKVSSIYFLPLIVVLLCIPLIATFRFTHLFPFLQIRGKKVKKRLPITVGALILFFVFLYATLRIADPYYFTDSYIFHITLNPLFLTNLHTLDSYLAKDAWFPPAVQWLHKTPIIFPLFNLAVFGFGLPLFALTILGIVLIMKNPKQLLLVLLCLYTILFFIYQGTQPAMTIRYFIFIYPLLCIFAAIGFSFIAHRSLPKQVFLCVLVLLWPLAFFSIYTKPHSRVTASEWIYQNIPNGSVILSEYWDDPLPLQIPSTKTFPGQQLAVFDPDTPQKWQKINQQLAQGDYLILSSNRGWGSIPTAPERYPQMTNFYQNLFAGKLAYKKVAEFTSYPSFTYFGIPLIIPDDIAEESFTVYDHPKVLIFKNTHHG